ncbi:MAG TPA: trypsin-like peptidase domain-containing protein [Rhizomicrobium sp.]|nr:trypsin-like peptidase domain-containing protein [Rhizomicrobium sp.]
MKRKPLYGRATRRRSVASRKGEEQFVPFAFDDFEQGPSLTTQVWRKTRAFAVRHDRIVPASLAILVTLGLIGGWALLHPAPAPLTQWDIDNAVKYTMDHTPPGPAKTTVAAATVAPSVVRVDGYLSPEHAAAAAKAEAAEERKNHLKPLAPAKPLPQPPKTADAKADDRPDSTGSGVVIDDKGDILTNLHVIHSTDRWVITFFDGSKSDAEVVNVQPENDLAVIRAKTSPDDLKPATLASTAGLYPGDTVVAVGFPFGIGPSVSSGVVAGLKREFDDPEDKDTPALKNLIQFTAPVNPGNSGGPLVNRDGEVVGIVTAIYNPTGQRVFAGMAFAVPIENAAKAVGTNPF